MVELSDRAFSFIRTQTLQTIGLNPVPVSKESLQRHFKIAADYHEPFDAFLNDLAEQGHIQKTSSNQYAANDPLGSLMIARYKKDHFERPHSHKHLDLEVLNLDPSEEPVFVRAARTDILRALNGGQPKENETFAIVAERRRGTELFAKRVIGAYTRTRKPTITGRFTNVSAENFSASLKGYGETTSIRIEGNPELVDPGMRNGIFYVKPDLNPRDPEVKFVGAKWDPATGQSIPSIIAKKHGLVPNHARETIKKANRAIQRPLSLAGRDDLRPIPFLVIDPSDARDNDDGIFIERTGWDSYRIITIIADMPWYVRSGSHLDAIARKRGFTHYFPDTTFHMLPEPLVHHASLKSGSEKPVVYVESFVDENGEKIDESKIGLGVIASQRQYSYDQFDRMLDTHPHKYAAYRELGTQLVSRMRQESLMFDVDEFGRPKSFSEMLVSSMMVHANAEISDFLQARGLPFPSRVHAGRSNPFAYEEFRKKLNGWGYNPPLFRNGVSNDDLKDLLSEAEHRNDKTRVEMAIRSEYLDRAQYSPMAQGHFGLNLDGYCHATSPIRRYADHRVLRAVHTALGQQDTGLSATDWDDLPQVCKEMNQLQMVQSTVAFETRKHYAVLSLQNMEKSYIKAKLHAIDPFHVHLLLPDRGGLRGRVEIDKLPASWQVGKQGNALIYKGNSSVKIGENIKIRIGTVHPDTGEWSFELDSPSKAKPTPSQERIQNLTWG